MTTSAERLAEKFNALLNGYSDLYHLSLQQRPAANLQDRRQELAEHNRPLYAGYVQRLLRLRARVDAILARSPSTAANNHRAVLETAEMNAVQAELDGLVGRLHIEVKAIIGFARLAAGDIFEVSVKHGNQKWKTRGKTQPDRAQRWDSHGHNFTCYPDHPLIVKVTEVRLIKSRTLSERNFDPIKFFSPQPQLVTMNLNAIGSLKLQMVVSWLPLMTTNHMNPAMFAPQAQISRSMSIASQRPNPSSDLDVQNGNSPGCQDPSPVKVCLRDKKRVRQGRLQPQLQDQQRWRSSTTILDSVYKDLSKSIPTIDDLNALTEKKPHGYQHRYQQSDQLPSRTSIYGSASSRPPKPHLGTYMLTKGSDEDHWGRSISMHHLALKSDENKNRVADQQAQTRPATSMTDSDDSSGVSSMSSQPKPSCRVADALLDVMDRIRAALGPLRCQELPELAAFEAAVLNWEALIKLNRAVLLEQSRTFRGVARSGSTLNGRLQKRASMYHAQHSPSTLSDELDEPGVPTFENDSGIDSLRQNTSPYVNRVDGSINGTASRGPAQRRFKQFKERRKSLGIMMDNEYDRFFQAERLYNEDPALSRSVSTAGSSPGAHRRDFSTATGNAELDKCVEHHLKQALALLTELDKERGPFEHRVGVLLSGVEQQTVALEEMMRIADHLPALPNVQQLLLELGATQDQQDLWMPTALAVHSQIMVTTERLQMNLTSFLTPVVESCYRKLTSRVVDSLLSLMVDRTLCDDNLISIFEFTTFFQGKVMAPFVENLAHEAFITSSLESNDSSQIKEVMDRLRKVPIVPPLESLRFVGKVLLAEDPECVASVERYLHCASDDLKNDLGASFVTLLEHKDLDSRIGACRALAVLKLEYTIDLLRFLSSEDENPSVRQEARRSMEVVKRFFNDYQEITKI